MLFPHPTRRYAVALILAAACWGIGTAVSKQAVGEVPPFTLLAVQLAVSLGFLLLIVSMRGDRMPPGRESRLLGRLGLLNPGIAYALSLVGLTEISASYSVLLWTLEPILIVILAGLVLGERIGGALVVLSGLAIAGLVVVLYDPSATAALIGVALTVAGVGCCAIYTVAARRWLPLVDATLPVIVAQEAYALGVAVILVIGAAIGGTAPFPTRLTAVGVASTIGSGLLYYGLAYWFYLTGLRRMRASVASAAFYLIPVFGVAAASLFGDRLTVVQLVGAGLVVVAVGTLTTRTAAAGPQPT